ncbi:hypothetical protein ACFQU7_07770 [Pseudoroseomonas wenyumeiae]
MAANQTDKTSGANPEKSKKENEQMVEKSLEDTFPASDPPSSGSPSKSVGWDAPEGAKKD